MYLYVYIYICIYIQKMCVVDGFRVFKSLFETFSWLNLVVPRRRMVSISRGNEGLNPQQVRQ